MSPAPIIRRLALAAGLFAAGWWAGRAFWPAPAPVSPTAPPSPPAGAAATAPRAPTAAEALARLARGDRTLSRRELAALLRDAPPAEIPGLLDLVANLPIRFDRERFRTALLARWVPLDPAAARRWAEARPAVSDRREASRDVLIAWAETAPATVAGLLKSVEGREDAETLDAVLSSWVASDPARAKAWVAGIENPLLREAALRSLVTTLAEHDPAAAFDTALARVPDHGARYAVGIAARAMVLRDPSAAAAILQRIPAGEAKEAAAVEIVTALSASDPRLAAEFALTLPAGKSRQRALHAAIGALASAPDAAFGWIEAAIPASSERTQATESALRLIAEHSPAEAARHLDRLPPDSRAAMAEWLVRSWAENDSASATDWINQLPAGPERDAAFGSLLGVRFQRDPVGALRDFQHEFAALSPAQLEKVVTQGSIFVSEFGPSSGTISSAQLVALLPLLPSDETRKQLLDSVFRHFSLASPETAAALITTLPAAQLPDHAFYNAADQWADASPTAAAAWAAALPDPTARHTACNAVINSWGQTDPDAAARWACGLPDEQLRLNAAERTAGIWASDDPVAAAQWVARLDDTKFRSAATEAVARIWLDNDFETAAAWLATTELPPERRAALLQEARR